MEVLYGIHPVEEAVRSGGRPLDHVRFARDRRDARLEAVLDLCRKAGVKCSPASKDELTRLAKTEMHQGIVAQVRERKFLTIEDLLAAPPRNGEHYFFRGFA